MRALKLFVAATAANLCALSPALADEESFAAWMTDFQDRAEERGFDRDFLTGVFNFDEPLEDVIELDRSQPEFVRPIWVYLNSAVSDSRIETGRTRLDEEASLFAAIEDDYGVDRAYLAAIWGLESAYGAIIGDRDVVQSLSTLAWDGRRRELFERELFAVLDILDAGHATRDQLIGGWAGAMGQTQFMPSTYLELAVDHDGDGAKNLWTDNGDALASAANYLSRRGWTTGEPWGVEVTLSDGFDYGLSDGRELSVAEWREEGVTRADGGVWTSEQAVRDARLLLPAGARGPAFLVHQNFRVFLRYNNATSYALAAGLLGDKLSGKNDGVIAAWPEDERPLARAEVETLQRGLTHLGYSTKGVDGRVGPNTRRALRSWQQANDLPADAFPNDKLLELVLDQAGMSG